MAAAGRNHNVSTTGDHEAAAVHTPMLAGYRRPSTAPLLDKQPEEQQSAQYWLPSLWCRPKADEEMRTSSSALAQEVRTASLYHVHGETFYHHSNSKVVVHGDDDHDEERQPLLKCTTPTSHRHVSSSTARDSAATVVAASLSANDHLVLIHDDAMVPPPVQVVVVQVEDDDKSNECSVVPHGQMIHQIDSSIPISPTVREEDESFGEGAHHSISSDGSWRVDKVKKLINVVTLVSLLILMYTRGFIH